MSPTSDKLTPPPENKYQNAVNEYRATLKWVVSTFGAVAAALVVSLQLTSLGALHGSRLYGALACVGAGLGAILIVIVAAVRVLEPLQGTYAGFAQGSEFKALRDFLEKDPTPLQGEARTAAELAGNYDRAQQAQQATWDAYQANKDDATHREAYERAKAEYDGLGPIMDSVGALGLYLYMRRRYYRMMPLVYTGIAVAGAGLIAFAYLANPPAQAQPKPPPPQIIFKKVVQAQPPNCASYYFTLDELADDEPNIGSHWPAGPLDAQARACNLLSKRALAHFLTYLGRR
jgi:hypothetical protein